MGHMQPVAEFFIKSDLIETEDRGFTCSECREKKHAYNICMSGEAHTVCTDCAVPEQGWYSRFSAPGYLDATDWHGPFKSPQTALKEIIEFYDA